MKILQRIVKFYRSSFPCAVWHFCSSKQYMRDDYVVNFEMCAPDSNTRANENVWKIKLTGFDALSFAQLPPSRNLFVKRAHQYQYQILIIKLDKDYVCFPNDTKKTKWCIGFGQIAQEQKRQTNWEATTTICKEKYVASVESVIHDDFIRVFNSVDVQTKAID